MSKITYQLLTKLAEGLLYTTYRSMAYLPDGSQREVILKHIHPHLVQDPVLMSHLSGFADIARGLLHPGLAPVWDLGEVTGETFFVREYLPGISLEQLFALVQDNEAILSPAMAIYLTQEIIDAISSIHRFRVPGEQPIYLFHGGLAPENIILTRNGSVVVTDAGLDVIFWRNPGIAWRLRQRKLRYQPPEYETGERPMRRGDGYGVAALLYQMVMGSPLKELAHHLPEGGLPAPSSRHPRVTEHFDKLLFTCLHPDVEQRMVQMKVLQKAFRQKHLLRQEAMEQRDAMAYLEALVSEAFSPEQESRSDLLFDHPFELTSLLPERVDLLPPYQRFRQPVYESTDTFHPHRSSPEEMLEALSASQISAPVDSVSIDAIPMPGAPLLIGFQDELGPSLHDEPSEYEGKTLAAPSPKPDKEDLRVSSVDEQDEHPNAPEKTEIVNINDLEYSENAEDDAKTSLESPQVDPLQIINTETQLDKEGTVSESIHPTESNSSRLSSSASLDALGTSEIVHHTRTENIEREGITQPKIEQGSRDALSSLDGVDANPEVSDEIVEEEDEIVDLEDEDEIGEATTLGPSQLLALKPPPAISGTKGKEESDKADDLLAEILDHGMTVGDVLDFSDEEELDHEEDLVTEDPSIIPLSLTQDDLISEEVTNSSAVMNPILDEESEPNQKDAQNKALVEEEKGGEETEQRLITEEDASLHQPTPESVKLSSNANLNRVPSGLAEPNFERNSDVQDGELLVDDATPPEAFPGVSSDMHFAASSSQTGMPETVALSLEQVSGVPERLLSSGGLPAHDDENPGFEGIGKQVGPPPGMPETVVLPHEQVQKSPDSTSAPHGPAAPSEPSRMPAFSSTPPSSLSPGQERFGKFILLNRVALGGMAEVFRAKFEGPGGFQKVVALKRILPEYTQDHNFLEMFIDEARIAGSLRHPNIVQIQELGEIDGVFFISMEYIDGIDLARVIKIRRALQQMIPVEIILDIGICICRALGYAHTECDPDGRPLQMIHRDVTPHNILISKKGECKLTDFGIAKAAQNIAETAVGELKGKISYMSPEQAEGRPLDGRSDIFQVGIVLYEMLTLRKMFEGSSDQSILYKIQNAQFEAPRRIMSDVPKFIEQVILKSLATEPSNRYQTSTELQKALMQCRSQFRPKDPVDVADFAHELLTQKDELLSQYAEARRKQVQQHAFSVIENQSSPPPQVSPLSTSPIAAMPQQSGTYEPTKESKKSSKFMVLLMLLLFSLGGVTTLFLLFGQKSIPPTVGISVFTNPGGADVQLDGKVIGQTPLFEKRLPFNKSKHRLRIEKPGFKVFELSFRFKRRNENKHVPVLLQRSKQRSPQIHKKPKTTLHPMPLKRKKNEKK